MDARTLSDTIVAALVRAGADRVFGMPGGGNNLDFIGAAEAAGMSFVLTHHESAAAVMAGVYGELTGAPGVCLVTRGPGAANAVNGVANATLDRQALVVVTDAVSSADAPRIAHQRLDQRALFAPVAKCTATLGGSGDTADTAATAATAAAAVSAALSPPRGAVHLDFDPAATSTAVPGHVTHVGSGADLDRALKLLAASERPVVLLGVGARDRAGEVRRLLAASNAPVLMTYRANGVVPDSWPSNAGLLTGGTAEGPILAAADLFVLIGLDAVELIPNGWPYSAPAVSFAEWPETSPYLSPEAEVVGDLPGLLGELAAVWPRTTWPTGAGNAHRAAEVQRLRAGGASAGTLTPQDVVDRARAAAPAGSIATIDAGAHMFPATALWPVEHPDEMLISSGLATMGFALPAAIAAALARPGRRVVCFTGDGGLGMCLGELETLARLRLDVTVVVFDDAMLSLIAIKAKPDGHGGAGAVTYAPVDFARVAEGYGLQGLHADSVGQLDAAFTQSFARGGPSLVDARVDPSGYPAIMAAVRGGRNTPSRPR